jgi:hypothetical protein
LSEYRYVGYLPTPALSKVLSLFQEYSNGKNYSTYKDSVEIVRLKARRDRVVNKNVLNPLPYMELTAIENKFASLDYSLIRHPHLNVSLLAAKLSETAIDEMVVEEIGFAIPKDQLLADKTLIQDDSYWDSSIWERSRRIVATFQRHFAGKAKTTDGTYLEAIKDHTEDEVREYGFKYSSLDLTFLQDLKTQWARGTKQGIRLGGDTHLIWRVLFTVDPDKNFARLRQYKREKGEVWVLVRDKKIGEWN